MNIYKKINILSKNMEVLNKKRKIMEDKISDKYLGTFVNENKDGASINPVPTKRGIKELKKFGIVYIKKRIEESKEIYWENPGISYEPNNCFCMICHSDHTVAYIEYGICPRFATCAKHIDFLFLGFYLTSEKKGSRLSVDTRKKDKQSA